MEKKLSIIEVYQHCLQRADRLRHNNDLHYLTPSEKKAREQAAEELYWIAALLERTPQVNP